MHPNEVELTERGVVENRPFMLVDAGVTIPFGVYAAVVVPGRVRVGDEVEPL